MLAALIFSLPNLDWNHPTDHCEFFSGKMSVTLGELQDMGGKSSRKMEQLLNSEKVFWRGPILTSGLKRCFVH